MSDPRYILENGFFSDKNEQSRFTFERKACLPGTFFSTFGHGYQSSKIYLVPGIMKLAIGVLDILVIHKKSAFFRAGLPSPIFFAVSVTKATHGREVTSEVFRCRRLGLLARVITPFFCCLKLSFSRLTYIFDQQSSRLIYDFAAKRSPNVVLPVSSCVTRASEENVICGVVERGIAPRILPWSYHGCLRTADKDDGRVGTQIHDRVLFSPLTPVVFVVVVVVVVVAVVVRTLIVQ